VLTAEYLIVYLHPMPDDSTAAMNAFRSERADRTFKAVKRVFLPADNYIEALFVCIPALFTPFHFLRFLVQPALE
jgi:hypothetical protein